MKKTYLLLLFSGFVFIGCGQVLSEDFESGLPEDYTSESVSLNSGEWTGTNFSRVSESHSGSFACKLKNKGSSNIITPNIALEGVRSVTLWATKTTDGTGSALQVRLSEDGGDFVKIGSTLVLEQDIFNEYTVDINSLSSNIKIQFYRTSGTVYLDDVFIVFASSTMPNDPLRFSATASSCSQIDLSWTDNDEEDQVLLAWNSSNSFGNPVDGTIYSVGDIITGGGEVLQYNAMETYDHMGLDAITPYFYRIWSYNGTEYSFGKAAHASTEAVPSLLKLMIIEMMQDPKDVEDEKGEFFEIYNYGDATINIDGFVIKDLGTNTHTINNGGDLFIHAGDFLVLGRNADIATNGGFTADYEYLQFVLGNNEDAIILLEADGTTEIDRVEYGDNSDWPAPTGKSMIFIGTSSDDNNIASNWMESRVREMGFDSLGKDKGSPGTNGMFQNLNSNTTWEGIGNWSEGNASGATNWSNGSPGSATNVIIDGDVIIDMPKTIFAECGNLTINNDKSVTVGVNKGLTVNGDYKNVSGTLNMKSDASGDASLIVEGSMNGDMIMERFIAPYTGSDNGWHLLSIPRTASFNISETAFLPTEGEDDMYNWNEATYKWENYFGDANPGFNMEPGRGYLVAYKSQESLKKFVGTMNNQDFRFTDLANTPNSSNPEDNGWHLLGNPFLSAIKWNDGHWALDQIGGIARIYNESMGNYPLLEANDPIPSSQGFFIQVNLGETGSLTIPLAARVHDNTQWYKNVEIPSQVLELKVSGGTNTFYDIAKIRFNEMATDDFDPEFDSHKIYGMQSAPQLFTQEGNEKYSLNTIAFQQNEKLLSLSFIAGTSGSFTMEVLENTILSEGKTYLEDQFNEQMIDLSNQSSYTFYATTDDNAHRFLLHFNGVTALEELGDETAPQIYAVEDAIYIHHVQDLDADIFIYNINGQLVGQAQMSRESMKRVLITAAAGIYLVTIQTKKAVYTEKVFIK